MPKAIITPTAKFRPGKCAVSGDTQGPFIDTGVVVPRYGRIYLSIKHIKLRLDEHGLLDTERTKELKEDISKLERKVEALTDVKQDHEELIERISKYVPTKERVTERKVVEHRKPTDEEIEEWIRRFGEDHPAVVRSKKVEKGSPEEWAMLYGDKKSKVAEAPKPAPEPTPTAVSEPVPQQYEYLGQNIDLDDVLSLNAKDVLEYADGKGEDFEAHLVLREFYNAEVEGRSPRKTILNKLGYWDDESNEPLIPDLEETE